MAINSGIVLICNDKNAGDILMSKINLLREADAIRKVSYDEANNFLSSYSPDLIIIYSDSRSNSCFELIDRLKCSMSVKQVPILLVCDRIEQNFLLSAFDAGIFEFTSLESSDSEVLVRVIWCLQKALAIKNNKKNMELLEDLDVLNKENGFYKESYLKTAFEKALRQSLKENNPASFVILTTDIDCKHKLSPTLLSSVLKRLLRAGDVVGIKNENLFYILLTKTGINGVYAFHERLTENLTHDYSVSIGAVEVNDANFDNLEKTAAEVLQQALKKTKAIVVADEKSKNTDMNWANESSLAPTKNFKLFKQSFIKKLNNVIAPVFFQVQKNYEEKLFDTKIEQICSEEQIYFILKKKYTESKLKITYPGFSKINIDIYDSFDEDSEKNRISLNLSEVDAEKITLILEKFIKEFRRNTNA